jgi:hypothetical protein
LEYQAKIFKFQLINSQTNAPWLCHGAFVILITITINILFMVESGLDHLKVEAEKIINPEKVSELEALSKLSEDSDEGIVGIFGALVGKKENGDYEGMGALYDRMIVKLKEMESVLSVLTQKGDSIFHYLEHLRQSMLDSIGDGSELPDFESFKSNGKEFKMLVSGIAGAIRYIKE